MKHPGGQASDEVDGHALVAMGPLHLAGREHPDHRPQRVGDGEGVGGGGIAEQHADPAASGCLGMSGHLVEEGLGAISRVAGGRELGLAGHGAEVAEERGVGHPVEHRTLPRGHRVLVVHPAGRTKTSPGAQGTVPAGGPGADPAFRRTKVEAPRPERQ